MTTKTVQVPNISCGHCVMTIEREVGGLNGVASVKGEAASKEVTVSWDPGAIQWDTIRDLMAEIDFPAAE
jgi:copper chaperone CopZ